jgi:hypothetical protein
MKLKINELTKEVFIEKGFEQSKVNNLLDWLLENRENYTISATSEFSNITKIGITVDKSPICFPWQTAQVPIYNTTLEGIEPEEEFPERRKISFTRDSEGFFNIDVEDYPLV